MISVDDNPAAVQNISLDSRRDLRKRTIQHALAAIRVYRELPSTTEAQILGKQMLRSGTSVGAQYHEAQRAKSDADFVSKIEGSLQELDETAYWLELLSESGILGLEKINPMLNETEELIAIFVTIVKNVKSRSK